MIIFAKKNYYFRQRSDVYKTTRSIKGGVRVFRREKNHIFINFFQKFE